MIEKIPIYRVEHKDSRQGPFEHADQIFEVLYRGIDCSLSMMKDLDNIPEVKRLHQTHKNIVYGFTELKNTLAFIKNGKVLKKHGFSLYKFKEIPLYISDDQQVLFLRTSEREELPFV